MQPKPFRQTRAVLVPPSVSLVTIISTRSEQFTRSVGDDTAEPVNPTTSVYTGLSLVLRFSQPSLRTPDFSS